MWKLRSPGARSIRSLVIGPRGSAAALSIAVASSAAYLALPRFPQCVRLIFRMLARSACARREMRSGAIGSTRTVACAPSRRQPLEVPPEIGGLDLHEVSVV